MRQAIDTGRLALTPEDPYYRPPQTGSILNLLQEIGFIAEPLAGDDKRYILGERFMELVNFMGCSPSILLRPGAPGQAFCHLVVDGPSELPRLLHGRNTRAPRCAACRERLPDWPVTFEKWRQAGAGWQAPCPHCGHRQDPATYDFRHSAGCGRLFLLIENIFPREATPSPHLLAQLQRASAQSWRYFYQQDGGWL
jgi:hypothetical protein